MRLHYLKYFKSDSHQNWIFNEIKSKIFDFKIPKEINYDTYEKLIYLIQKLRKKYYSDAISKKSAYDFQCAFYKDKNLINYFTENNCEIRYFHFFKMYLLDLLGFRLSKSELGIVLKNIYRKVKIYHLKLKIYQMKKLFI